MRVLSETNIELVDMLKKATMRIEELEKENKDFRERFHITEDGSEQVGNPLEATVGMMLSTDYKERLKAEYIQARIRFEKLAEMIAKWDTLPYKTKCTAEMASTQLTAMTHYIGELGRYAKAVKVNLED